MNNIHETAIIHPNVILGNHNVIGKFVEINIISNDFSNCIVRIGDNNRIADYTRIIINDGNFYLGDWNVIHNNCLLLSGSTFVIKNNCWIGQSSVLDGTGGLRLGNGVRVGMNSQIWSHAISGELIEGCKLFIKQETILEDDVWLVGSCLVSSGIKLEKRVIALLGSVINSDFSLGSVISGNPAQIKKGIKLYGKVNVDQKYEMMLKWGKDFIQNNHNCKIISIESGSFKIISDNEVVNVVKYFPSNPIPHETYLIIEDKSMIKQNSGLERKFYQYLYSFKARFNPR